MIRSTSKIYTLSLHDALPISNDQSFPIRSLLGFVIRICFGIRHSDFVIISAQDRKSTRLNSSHLGISYAVFCLKKKKRSSTHFLIFLWSVVVWLSLIWETLN